MSIDYQAHYQLNNLETDTLTSVTSRDGQIKTVVVIPGLVELVGQPP